MKSLEIHLKLQTKYTSCSRGNHFEILSYEMSRNASKSSNFVNAISMFIIW